jgi:septum site-determining protein MinC
MPSEDPVIIKGVRDGLLILLDDDIAWPDLLAEVDARLSARRAFFSGATVTANLGDRALSEAQFGALRSLFQRFDMLLDVIVSTSEETRAVAGVNGVRNRAPAFGRGQASTGVPEAGEPPPAIRPRRRRPPALPPDAPASRQWPADGEPDFGALAGEDNTPAAESTWAAGAPAALFVRRTLRSGMSILHDGDVCILGDVNAGAEIVAGGDVVVWGSLRGMIHAGAGGDQAAVVCALLLAPTQLRIADLVSRGSEPSGPAAPEMARILDGRILVEPWSARRK